MLQIRLLGQFDVRAHGQRIVIPSRAGQSLFAYMLLTSGTIHRREKLAGLFWPDISDEQSRRYLRNELWRVRKAIQRQPVTGDDYLLADEFSLWFNSDADYWLDAAALQSPVQDLDSLISNLSLYQGELLPGFYEEWVLLERDRLRVCFDNKMQDLVARLLQEQRWTTVVEWSERWIAIEQTPEAAYRALMVAYAATGSRAQVAASYERVRLTLAKDLGVEPSEETRGLYEQIMRGETVARVDFTAHTIPPVRLTRLDEPPAPGEPPFKGLEYFDECDAELYFGREALIAQLAERWCEFHFLAFIVGSSGSGKSSFVRAGLVPALKRGRFDKIVPNGGSQGNPEAEWRILIITPTAHPIEALAIALTCNQESVTATTTLMDDLTHDARSMYLYLRRATSPASIPSNGNGHTIPSRTLLVVDQFEEVFTLCHDLFEREQFIDNLLYALNQSSTDGTSNDHLFGHSALRTDSLPSFHLVLTLRADFYAHLAQYSELRTLFAKHQEYIGPMSADEMRRAIQEPAKRRGWEFEVGLVDLLLRDVGNEPGALPLLSHALLETWKRRSGHLMTLKGYQDAGGVQGAIAHTAETAYQQLDAQQQEIARDIFLRLTELGEATEDTRRRATFYELVPQGDEGVHVRAVLRQLADVRLVTLGETGAEVAHEALIREWPRLREWLNEDRDGLRLHRQLTEAAHEWELLERDAGALYRGARLAQAREWAGDERRARMNDLERAFLDASIDNEEGEQREREEQQHRELEAAKRFAEAAQTISEEKGQRLRAQAQANKQLRRRTLLLAGAFIMALGLAGIALFLGGRADQDTQDFKERQNLMASRELAAAAVSNLDVDPQRSILLSLQALATAHTLEAENALHRAVSASRILLNLTGHSQRVYGVAFSPNATRIATAGGDKTARVWDAATGTQLLVLKGHTDNLDGIAFDPDGTRIGTASWDKTVRVWDAVTGAELVVLRGHMDRVLGIAFSPDGKRIATSSRDDTIRIWDAAIGKQILVIYDYTGVMNRIAYSPDGKQIALGFDSGMTKVWDVLTGAELHTFSGHLGSVSSVAFSPDGTRLASAGADKTVKIWEVANGKELLGLRGHTSAVFGVKFSANGAHIATTSSDGTVKLWNATLGTELLTLRGHTGAVNDVAFSPDCVQPPQAPFQWCGTRIVSGGDDRTARVWDVTPAGSREVLTLPGMDGRFSRDGAHLFTLTTDRNIVRGNIWKIAPFSALQVQTFTLAGNAGQVNAIALDGDSLHLATGSDDGRVRLWNNLDGTQNPRVFYVPKEHVISPVIRTVAFSPGGKHLATGTDDRLARIWDLEGNLLVTLTGHSDLISQVNYSADGERIITAAADNTAKIWDAKSGEPLIKLAGHLSALESATFSLDGRLVATGSIDGTAKVWDAKTGRELATMSGPTGAIKSISFSPDGSRLATGTSGGSVRLWEVASAKESLALPDQNQDIMRVEFSPDGTRLAVGGKDGTVRLYLLQLEDLIALAKMRLTRTWTPKECLEFLHADKCPTE